jgi:ABC-type polysaccharide/polyol phosphate transport system ATPase subunit
VSHNRRDLETACNRVMWMDHGIIVAEGAPSEVLDLYNASQQAAR